MSYRATPLAKTAMTSRFASRIAITGSRVPVYPGRLSCPDILGVSRAQLDAPSCRDAGAIYSRGAGAPPLLKATARATRLRKFACACHGSVHSANGFSNFCSFMEEIDTRRSFTIADLCDSALEPHISESVRARKLKFYTHLDRVNCSISSGEIFSQGAFARRSTPCVIL